jgi:hypothetical protein
MNILVISDSHGDNVRIKLLLEKYAGKIQAVLHLGDHDRDLLRHTNDTPVPLLAVAGNMDDTVFSPRERVLVFGNCSVFMTHGHIYHLNNGIERLSAQTREKSATVCLYGHTHVSAVFTEDGIFFMNPGSLTKPRDENPPGYGLLTIDDKTGAVSGEIVFL